MSGKLETDQCDAVKINLGCGDQKWEDFINVDKDEAMKPDLVMDIALTKYPWVDASVDEIWLCHTIEHISKQYWDHIFGEINRVLKVDGKFYLSYPEFTACYTNWFNNYQGRKEFWEATIFGRQNTPDDFHVVICHTPDMIIYLEERGFNIGKWAKDGENHNAVLELVKKRDIKTREDVINDEIFGIRPVA